MHYSSGMALGNSEILSAAWFILYQLLRCALSLGPEINSEVSRSSHAGTGTAMLPSKDVCKPSSGRPAQNLGLPPAGRKLQVCPSPPCPLPTWISPHAFPVSLSLPRGTRLRVQSALPQTTTTLLKASTRRSCSIRDSSDKL